MIGFMLSIPCVPPTSKTTSLAAAGGAVISIARSAAGTARARRRVTFRLFQAQRRGARPRGRTLSRRSADAGDRLRDGCSLHQMPVQEALQPAVEIQHRAGAQEPVRLGRVRDVLERLAEAAQPGAARAA